MLEYMDIIYYMSLLDKEWGAAGHKVVEKCYGVPLNMTCDQFLKHCSACGGNWGGMLLSGIKRLRPEVYDAVPDDMGHNAWNCIIATLRLLGVDF